jgi:hypothetical protein
MHLRTKSVTQVGTYLASALNIAIAAGTRADPWVADNPLYGHYDWYAEGWVGGCLYESVCCG